MQASAVAKLAKRSNSQTRPPILLGQKDDSICPKFVV
jgi:hypothetical protein